MEILGKSGHEARAFFRWKNSAHRLIDREPMERERVRNDACRGSSLFMSSMIFQTRSDLITGTSRVFFDLLLFISLEFHEECARAMLRMLALRSRFVTAGN